MWKFVVSAAVGAAMLVTPQNQARAGSGDALAGALVGGAIVGIIANEKAKQKRRTYTPTKRVYYNTAQRQENREVQTSLNYFNFPAGSPDGVLGRRSRAAISNYQAYMNYPVTGQLTEYQKQVLITSYQQAVAGAPVTMQVIAQSGEGHRGLLRHNQSIMAGGPGTVMAATVPQQVIVNPQPVIVNQAAPQQQQPQQQMASAETDTAGNAFSMPSFGNAPGTQSMANHCNKIGLVTNTNGGYTKVSNIQDPVFTLNEQFCLARIYAISQSEELAGAVQGVNAQQMQKQCEGLGPAFKEQVSALSLGSVDQVKAKTSEMILSTGMAPAQLAHTARICLGIGYRTDNADVALASTLILVVLGEGAYGELLGHHLVNGFGTSQRRDLSVAWYGEALGAIDAGSPAVFVPGQTERPLLIRAAVQQLGTPTTASNNTGTTQAATFVVPTFNSDQTSN